MDFVIALCLLSFQWFTGCRLCRRAPEQQQSNLNSCFLGFLDLWDRFNLVRIEFPSNLPQELRRIIGYCAGNESQTFWKFTFNALVPNCTFIWVLWETAWGKMFILTVGAFHVFTDIVTSIWFLQVKVIVLLKTSIFIFSVWTIYSSSEDRYMIFFC